MLQPDLLALDETARLAFQKAVDLLIGDLDLVDHLLILEAGGDDLGAGVFAEVGEANPPGFERGLQLFQVQPVALGDIGQGLVEGRLLDLDPQVASALRLEALEDESVEHLLFELVTRRRSRARLLHLRQDQVDLGVELAAHDDIVVDHGDDGVQLLNGRLARRRRRPDQQAGEE